MKWAKKPANETRHKFISQYTLLKPCLLRRKLQAHLLGACNTSKVGKLLSGSCLKNLRTSLHSAIRFVTYAPCLIDQIWSKKLRFTKIFKIK